MRAVWTPACDGCGGAVPPDECLCPACKRPLEHLAAAVHYAAILAVHYAAILAVATAAGWPERFATDLTVHDRRSLLRRDPSEPFAWILFRGGTGLVFPNFRIKPEAAHMVASYADVFASDGARCFWWDGCALRELSRADACEAMVAAEEAQRRGAAWRDRGMP